MNTEKSLKFNLVAIFMVCISIANAQTPQIDSLKILLEQSSNDSLWFKWSSRLGNEFNKLENSIEGKKYAANILERAKLLGDIEKEVWANMLYSDYYYKRQEFDSSLFYALSANQLALRIQNNELLIDTHCDVGMVYFDLKEYEKSIEENLLALDILKLEKKGDFTRAYIGLANALGFNGSFNDAIKYYKLAEDLVENGNNKDYLAALYTNWGAVYFFIGDYKKSIELYKKGYEIEKANKGTMGMAIGLINIGEAYDYLSDYEKALKYLTQGLNLARSVNDRNVANSALLMLSETYGHKKDYENSLKYYKSYVALRDSLFNEDKMRQVADMEVLYETEKKENKIETLEKDQQLNNVLIEKEKNRKVFFGILSVVLLLLSVMMSYVFLQIRKSKRALDSHNKLITDINKKLSASQDDLLLSNKTKDKFFALIAHDLRGPITSLQGIGRMLDFYTKEGDLKRVKKLIEQIDQSSNSVNHLLDNLLKWALSQNEGLNCQPSVFSLKILIDDGVDIFEEALKAKEIELLTDLDEKIRIKADYNMMSTVIRNLLSNAIKYTGKSGKIVISAVGSTNFINIEFKDKGLGMSTDQLNCLFETGIKSTEGTKGEKGTGLGLILCKEFIEKNGGKISVKSEEGKGTNVSLQLPALPLQENTHIEDSAISII